MSEQEAAYSLTVQSSADVSGRFLQIRPCETRALCTFTDDGDVTLPDDLTLDEAKHVIHTLAALIPRGESRSLRMTGE